MVYFIWGFEGLSTTCYFLAFIFCLIALGSLGLKSASGCMGSFVSVLGLGFLGLYFGSISSEKEKNTPEEQIVSQNDSVTSTDNYENDLYSDTTAIGNSSETENSQASIDYETYIDNQLSTGSKPYKKYYHTRTGRNYLDFNTSGNDYVIIVRDCATNDVVNHIYIRANDTGRLYLPNGTYNIYFYGGKGWNPNMKNGNVEGGFVSDGQVQKDGPIVLEDSYGEYTLYPVRNGNLGTDWGTLGYMVGEHWHGDSTVIQMGSVNAGYTSSSYGNTSNAAKGYGLNSCFDFPAYYKVVQGFAQEWGGTTTENITTGLSYLYKTYSEKGYSCKEDDGSYETYYPNFMLSNHDLFRVGDLINKKYNDGFESDNYAKRNMVLCRLWQHRTS